MNLKALINQRIKNIRKRRNKFKTTYLDTLTNKSLYHHLKNIERQ